MDVFVLWFALRFKLIDGGLCVLDNELWIHYFGDVWSLEMVGWNHSGENVEELWISQQTILIHLTVFFDDDLQIFEQPLLELDCLSNISIVDNAINAMAEVRGAKIEFVFHCFAFELHRKFHLAWASGGNLKQNYTKSETICWCSSLEEFHVDITLHILLISVLSSGKSLDL